MLVQTQAAFAVETESCLVLGGDRAGAVGVGDYLNVCPSADAVGVVVFDLGVRVNDFAIGVNGQAKVFGGRDALQVGGGFPLL